MLANVYRNECIIPLSDFISTNKPEKQPEDEYLVQCN